MEAAFNRAKRACYAGLDSVRLRREITDSVAGAVPFDAHAFSTCDPDTGIMSHTVAEGIPGGLGKMYIEILYPAALGRLAADTPRRGSNVFSMADETPMMQSALRAYGISEQMHVSASTSGRVWGTWCLMWGRTSSKTSSRHLSFLDRLAPHLARGLQSAALIDQGLGERESSSSEDGPGVLILDSSNRPTLRTPDATTWLADLRDVGLSMPDDIPLSVISLAFKLRAARDGGAREEQVRVRGLSGRWYLLRASLSEPDATGQSSVVVVIRPAMPLEVATILTRLYGFSAREREVIAAVARGEPTKTIALTLGVSPHTVTEHIDRACHKLGVSGRKALVAKLFFECYAPTLFDAKPASVL